MNKIALLPLILFIGAFVIPLPLMAQETPVISNIRLEPNPTILGDECWLTVDFKSRAPLTKVYVYIQYYVKGKPAGHLFQIIDVEETLPEIAGKTKGEIKTWWIFKNPRASKREFRIWVEDENQNISAGLFLTSTHR